MHRSKVLYFTHIVKFHEKKCDSIMVLNSQRLGNSTWTWILSTHVLEKHLAQTTWIR